MHHRGMFWNGKVRKMKHKEKESSIKTGKSSSRSISIRTISMSIIAFMMGRIELAGGLSPFGMAFFAATYGGGISPITIGTSIAIGAFTYGNPGKVAEFIAMISLFGILGWFANWCKVQGEFVNVLKISTSVFLVKVFPLFFKVFLIYDFVLSIFQTIVTVMLYFVLKKGSAILLADQKKNVLTAEEVISLSVIGTLTIVGIRDFSIAGIELRSVISVFVILLFARISTGAGTAAGVSLGLFSSLAGMENLNVVSSYAFSGLLAGMFRKLGNIGVVLGFLTGNSLITYLSNGSLETLIQLRDIILASVLFFLVPSKVVNKTEEVFKNSNTEVEKIMPQYQLKPVGVVTQKLNNFSKAMEEVAVALNKVAQPEEIPDKNVIASFFDAVAERVCKDCSLYFYCWEKKFQNTYDSMFTMLEILEHRNKLVLDDVPECFSDDSCVRPKELVENMNNLYEVYKVNLLWKKKVNESRGVVSQQLQGISKMISQLADEINLEISHKNEIEAKLTDELIKNNFPVDKVLVENDLENGFEITLYCKECPGTEKCKNELPDLISSKLGKRTVRKSLLCSQGKVKTKCMQKFSSVQILGVTTGISRINKHGQNICGDNYTLIELKNGKYVLGLSDGMGAGEIAANNSQIAVSLLQKLLEAGFDKDIAVKIINSVFVLKSANESYATIDISTIDLCSGHVEFIKIGSPPSYIKKKNRVEIIKAASLPAGILEDIDLGLCDTNIEPGDFIIMVTDGVSESNFRNGNGDWLKDFLNEVKTENPQELAELIINRAKMNYGERINDDMTALVAKVWEKV